MKKLLLSSCFLLLSFCSYAQGVDKLQGSEVAIAYKLPNSNNIYGVNYDTYLHPASTQKLLTALAALLYLGPDWTIKTKLMVKSSALDENFKLKLTENGTLNSDVIIKFSGDPTFSVSEYRKLLGYLKRQGVKVINGSVKLDISRFSGRSRAPGWSWDDLPVCFTAPSAAIILNKNCTFAQLQTQNPGEIAFPIIPKGVPIDIISHAQSVNASDYGGDCQLEANIFIDNKYQITGCVPILKDNRPYPLSLAISDPIRWGIDWTKSILEGLDIGVSNGIKVLHNAQDGYSTIQEYESAPLYKLLDYTLKKSNNLYADSIAKNLAAEYHNLPATYYRATRAIRAILLQYAHIDLGNAYIVDGSGLSPHNLVSAKNLLDILTYIKNHEDTLHFLALLPQSGVSGTLQWRASTVNAPLKTRVYAKTGTLENISNLAGFVKSKNNNLIPFVILTNSITYDERTRDRVKYRRMKSPHYKYERYILENIYNEKKYGQDFK